MKRLKLFAAALAAAALGALTGGWAPAPGLEAARQRWASEAAEVDASLAALEERLLASQARVHLWEEMRSRHQTVSQVACENLGEHARALVASAARSADGERARALSRLASAKPAPAGGVGGP